MAKLEGEAVLLASVPITAPAPRVKGVASHPEGRVAAVEERDLGSPQGPPGTPQASWAPDQAGFLVTFTHFQAWFESAETPQASVSCLPRSKAWLGPRRISPDV